MSTLDPRLRFDVVAAMQKALYKQPRAKQFIVLATLIQENSAIKKNTQKCVRFNGEVLWYVKQDGRAPRPINQLDKTLKDRMRVYLTDRDALSREQEMTMGYARKVLAVSDRIVDLYPLIPHTLHRVLREYAAFFVQGEGKLCGPEISEFLIENDKYSQLMKSRMTYNLIDVS
jgi:hypothetical protein